MQVKKIFLAAFVLAGSMQLAGCGGGDNPTHTAVVTTPTTATINPTTGAAVVQAVLGKRLSFNAGISAFGTTTPTVLTLSGSGATPSFSLTSGSDTAKGQMTYGSCIFTVTSSTYPAGHRLAKDQVTKVSPCALTLDTAGKIANGNPSSSNVTFVLDASTSSPETVIVSINANGSVMVNGIEVGSATVVITTGSTGSGG